MKATVWRLCLVGLLLATVAGARSEEAAASSDTLGSGQWLFPGQYVISGNGLFEFIMQDDGNLVLYYMYGASTPLWDTGTGGQSVLGVAMQTDGNLVLYNSAGGAIWSSHTNVPGSFLIAQNDGNLVIYAGASPVWATYTTQDTPGSGYWSATDSNAPSAGRPASSPIYVEPTDTSLYGGYVAEVDTYFDDLGCATYRAVNSTNVADANANWATNSATMGTALYYYSGGPGADPSYNGTTSEAYAWGQRQGQWAVNRYSSQGPSYRTGLIFLDIDRTYGDGWNDVTKGNCSYTIYSYGIDPAVDRATFNGFWDYVYYNTGQFFPGVYSSQGLWNFTFGTGSNGSIPNTYEWTYENQTMSTAVPSSWCYGNTCAAFFGGTSKAIAWQWAIGSTDGNVGDFDQIYMCSWSRGC